MNRARISPESVSRVEQSFADLLAKIAERIQRNESDEVESLIQAYPQHQRQLRQLLPTLQAMTHLSQGPLTEPGFPSVQAAVGGDGLERIGGTTRVLGDFRIIREIGRGGMAAVYEAEQISLGRRVALKVLPFAALLDQRQLQRFRNEAHAAATLQHPHIVPVISIGSERGVHYYAMHLVEGPSLAELLLDVRHSQSDYSGTRYRASREGESVVENVDLQQPDLHGVADSVTTDTRRKLQAELSTERTISPNTYYTRIATWGVQSADALAYAHDHGVLHRDIKPANLLIDADQKLWITDFGLARLEGDPSMTMSGDVLGTIRYMPPEQATGNRAGVDHRSDVYSLGATLYELLTLRPAFEGSNREELLQQVTQKEPRSPRRLDSRIPTELVTIVQKAMEKDPRDRFDTARDMADDLQRFLQQKPLKARPPRPFERITKWSRRHVAVVWSVFAVLLVTIAALLTTLGVVVTTRSQLAQAYEMEKEQRRLAKATVDDWYVRFGEEWIQHQPGLTQAQSEFLQKASDFYSHYASQSEDPYVAELEVCKAQRMLAAIQEKLGNDDIAQELIQKNIERLEPLIRQESLGLEPHLELARCWRGLTEVTGYSQHLSALSKAVDVLRQVPVEHQRDRDFRVLLATTKTRLGDRYAHLAEYARADGLHAEALSELEKLVRDYPDEIEYRACLADELRAMCVSKLQRTDARTVTGVRPGLKQEAAEYYRRCVAQSREIFAANSVRIRHRYLLANACMNAHGFIPVEEAIPVLQEAATRFEELHADYPEIPEYHRRLRLAYHQLEYVLFQHGRYDEALSAAQKQAALTRQIKKPGWQWGMADAYGIVARSLKKLGRFEEARDALLDRLQLIEEHLAIVQSKSEQLPDYRIWCVADCAEAIQDTSDDLAVVLTNLGEIQEADRIRTNALHVRTSLMQEIEGLAHAPDKSATHLRNLAWLHYATATDLLNAGRLEEAAAESQKAIFICVNLPDGVSKAEFQNRLAASFKQLASIQVKQRKYADALESDDRCAQIWLDHAPVFSHRARVHAALGNHEAALADLKQAMELTPAEPDVHEDLGDFHHKRRQYEAAFESFSKMIECAPNSSTAFAKRGATHLALRHYDEALADLRRAVEITPTDANAGAQLAWLLSTAPPEFRQIDEALLIAQHEIARNNNGLDALGAVYYRQGRFQVARQALVTAANAEDEKMSVRAWIFLAMTYWQLGEYDTACQWHKKAADWLKHVDEPSHTHLQHVYAEATSLLATAGKGPPAPAVGSD